jgi:UDP-glucose 6-dehydrogenase
MHIGVIGLGFVGNAINSFFIKNNFNTFIYDKYKNINTIESVLEANIVYICLPTLYCDIKKTYDMIEIDNTLMLLHSNNYKGIILIKSTILPSYCTMMNNMYPHLTIIHNPEFLTARSAVDDFANQIHIILGYTMQSKHTINMLEKIFKDLFPRAIISSVIAEEAGLCKLACNSFYATKIQYFTEIFYFIVDYIQRY